MCVKRGESGEVGKDMCKGAETGLIIDLFFSFLFKKSVPIFIEVSSFTILLTIVPCIRQNWFSNIHSSLPGALAVLLVELSRD